MKHFAMIFAGTMLLSGLGAARAAAQSASAEDVIKAASQAKLELLGKRILMFAREIPADKYTWNPGVMLVPAPPDPQADPYGRLVADLFLHVANLNFTRPVQLGASPPADFDPKDKNYETSTTDKAKVIEQLTKSFAYAQDALQTVSVADLQKRNTLHSLVGPPGTPAGSVEISGVTRLMDWMNDLSEYEGQTIAYGRLNGVIGTGEKFALRPAGK